MTIVVIGKKDYDLPPLNFKRMKLVWPLLKDHQAEEVALANPEAASELDMGDLFMRKQFGSVDVALRVIAIAMQPVRPGVTFAELEEELLPDEIGGITPALLTIMQEGGLMPETGKLEAELAQIVGQLQKSSTETSTPLLDTLSRQVSKAAAGT